MTSHSSALSVVVSGTPTPKGSMKCVGRPGGRHQLIEAGNQPKKRAWRDAVRHAITAERHRTGHRTLTGPVDVRLIFFLPQPASQRHTPLWAPTSHATGDLDKLVRTILDELTAAEAWRDDSQACQLTAQKFYSAPGAHWGPGCIIYLEDMEESDDMG